MKLISFFYPSTEVKRSINFILFFRFVGIYVVEVQTDLISMYEDRYEDKVILSDAVLYLSTDKTINYMFDYKGEKDKFIELKKDELDKNADYNKDNHDENNYDKQNFDKNILFVLDEFKERKIIDLEEHEDLKAALEVFTSSDYSYIDATLCGKYYFKQSKESCINDINGIYRKLGFQLVNKLKEQNISLWGNEKYIHCRYAFINIFFELNIFCKKNNCDYYIDSESLLNACKHIDAENGQNLGNSFKILQAQIYDQLLGDMGEAFKIYVSCCNNPYDSYVYFCKGDMMYRKRELERAKDYFTQSTRIYPQYYRAWYKLAVCYKELDIKDNWKEALEGFGKVVQILHNKANNNLLRALEVEYLFDSYMHILDIKKKMKDYRGALAYCDEALKTYLNLGENKFYKILNIRLMKNKRIKKDITSHLDIAKLEKEGIELSMRFDLISNAIRYADLMAKK